MKNKDIIQNEEEENIMESEDFKIIKFYQDVADKVDDLILQTKPIMSELMLNIIKENRWLVFNHISNKIEIQKNEFQIQLDKILKEKYDDNYWMCPHYSLRMEALAYTLEKFDYEITKMMCMCYESVNFSQLIKKL